MTPPKKPPPPVTSAFMSVALPPTWLASLEKSWRCGECTPETAGERAPSGFPGCELAERPTLEFHASTFPSQCPWSFSPLRRTRRDELSHSLRRRPARNDKP